MKEDLTIKASGGTIFLFDSKNAKNNFLEGIGNMIQKAEEIKEKNHICGDCAAYPCFRNIEEDSSAGLCYQDVRQCRDECNEFVKIDGSGKSPEFQIRGTCKKDNSEVLYEAECRFLK